MFHVYRVLNTVNGKSYVGITARTPSVRWHEHCVRARENKRDSRLHAAIRKYGKEKFEVETLVSAETEELVRALETHFINYFDSYKSGYNCNLGGNGFLKFPDEIRKKISEAQKGKFIPKETRLKMAEAKRGDSRCAKHFGRYTNKGAESPLAKSYLFEFPDGHTEVIRGLRAFCRDNNLHMAHIRKRGHSKGFKLLRTFNDHPEREYGQAAGNGAGPG